MILHAYSRAGNAIVLTLGIITLVAALLVSSATSSVAQSQLAQQRIQQIDALAAVEAVLSRREALVLAKASDGTLFNWTGIDGQEPNFGREFFGECEVRWTIEPARSPRAADVNRVADDLQWIGNPPPDTAYTPLSPQQTNDFIYLYRIAAQATKRGAGNYATAQAQGVRYVSINQEPLFRYVIFYAPRGPKGDLELSHSDDVTIQGSVHTNGALYLGARTITDSFSTTRGPSGRTRIGPVDYRDLDDSGAWEAGEPTNVPVRVNGVDGIFRLSKPLMFGALNSLPIGGTAPGSWSTENAYRTGTGVAYPRDAVAGVDATQLDLVRTAQRDQVNFLNPYRVTNVSGFVTNGEGYTSASGDAEANARTINDRNGASVPILGTTENGLAANDARDGSPADAPGRWRTASMAEFGGQARTNETGGRLKNLPEELIGTIDLPIRPLEAQAIQYVESDADTTTDDHEFAQPIFRSAAGTTTNPKVSADDFGGQIVEAPGRYLSLALGAGRNMARRTTGGGWDIVNDTGAPVAANGNQVGLVIRERMVPDITLWPGATNTGAMDSSNAAYMPYAYGKHFRPSNWPFSIADVSDGLDPNAQNDTWGRFGLDPSLQTNRDSVNLSNDFRNHRYEEGGKLVITAAVAEGQSDNNHPTAPTPTYQRRPRFYADNWRFVHLRQPSLDAEPAGGPQPGYVVRWFTDKNPNPVTTQTFYNNHASTAGTNWFNLLGTPQATYNRNGPIVIPLPTAPTAAEAPGFDRGEYFSVRVSAYVVPQYSEVYTFKVDGVDDGSRLWLDGKLMTATDFWKDQGGASSAFPTSFPLTAGRAYHLVVEHYQGGGGVGLNVKWSSPTQPEQLIPDGIPASIPPATPPAPLVGLYRMDNDMGFPAATFNAIEAKIPVSAFTLGTRDEKAALMIRNNAAGLSPLLSGRDRYLAIGFNPQRGVFVQRRLQPAKPRPTDVSSFTYFIGKGKATQTAPTATVITSTLGVMQIPATRQSDTSTYNGQPYTYSDYTRDAKVTPAAPTYAAVADGITNNYTGATSVQVNTKSFTINMGDGVNVSVRAGTTSNSAETASRTQTPRSQRQARRDKRVLLTLSGHEAGFQNADSGRQIRFFGPTSTSTTNSISYDWDGIDAWLSSTQIRMDYRETSTWSAYNVGSPLTANTFTVQPNWVFGNPAQSVVDEMIAQSTGGRANWVKAPGGAYTYSGGVISVTLPTTSTFPTAPAAPAINPNTNWNDGFARSFAVNRGSTTVTLTHDINSYVSAHGMWFATPQTQWLPFNQAWFTNYPIVTPALTHGFAPDMWAGALPVLAPFAPAQGVAPRSVVTAAGRWLDDQPNAGAPAVPVWGSDVWLRIERVGATNNFRFRYSLAAVPAAANWQSVTDNQGAQVVADLTGWQTLLAGPAVQSGSRNNPSTMEFKSLKVEFNAAVAGDVNGDNVLNATDWDSAGAAARPLATTRYLASQYQVFWGSYDITEDFFAYCETTSSARTATEDWIYSPREFWSQNRRWENGVEKDDTSLTNIINRMLWSKTTMLSLNMGSNNAADNDSTEAGVQIEGIQGYLRSRTLTQAVRKPISNGPVPTVDPADAIGQLWTQFNGLLYAARTNRYPFNPNRSTAVDNGFNPWSFNINRSFPNRYVGSTANDYVSMDPNTTGWNGNDFRTTTNVHLLQPYALALAPPIKPQEFHHGVRLMNASRIWYGYQNNALGEGRLSVVTPNQMYVHGNVNSVTNTVTTPSSPGTPREKHTPMAVFGDTIHLLSNAFRIDRWQNPGITVTSGGGTAATWSGTGVLADPTRFAASNTEYWTCFLTHNIPTTRHSVREGQGAAFVDTMMFMENWGGRTMRYVGSLVVLDSRRYTRAFLMDSNKGIGRTVMGKTISSNLPTSHQTVWAAIHGAAEWTGQAPLGYNPPLRVYEFNDDLLIEQGTPPFTPFGLTVSGLGGWSRITR